MAVCKHNWGYYVYGLHVLQVSDIHMSAMFFVNKDHMNQNVSSCRIATAALSLICLKILTAVA